MRRTLVAITALLTASLAAADDRRLADFEGGALAGTVLGATLGPERPTCASLELDLRSDASGAGSVLPAVAFVAPASGQGMLALATTPESGRDDLATTSWVLPFTVASPSRLELRWQLVTTDDPRYDDWFAVTLDGELIACGTTSGLALAEVPNGKGARATSWSAARSQGPLEAGDHELRVYVGDGTDSTGTTWLLVDDVQLGAALQGVDPCRPFPPEDVGEVLWSGSTDTTKTFDDNRFCAAGDGDPSDPGLMCRRCLFSEPCPNGPFVDPNPGTTFVDSTGLTFEMFVVADCGTEMHVPLFDVESGCISVLDPSGTPVSIQADNGAGFFQAGLEVCWTADNCDGNGVNDPGGPGNERTMDVSFAGSPTLCGVYTVRFRSWAGCIWDLFANCNGTSTPRFDIYDDLCDAEDAVNPLPELAVSNLQLGDPGGCRVEYCVDYRNIGCATSEASEVLVANEWDADTHVVGALESGETVTLCGILGVVGSGTVFTTVTAVADSGNDVVECSEASNASSCDPLVGGDSVTDFEVIDCAMPPLCDAGGPYVAACLANDGGTHVQLDGTGSSDPDGGAIVSYAWTTTCEDSSFDDATAAQPVLTVDAADCPTCTVTLTVRDDEGASATCQSTVTITDTTPPEITCPEDALHECGDPTANRPAWMGTHVVTDACDPNVTVTPGLIGFNEPCEGARREVWRFQAIDHCGNLASCQAVWEIEDTTPPIVTPPAPRTVECGTVPPTDLILWLLQATAMDACVGSVQPTNQLVSTLPLCGPGETLTYRFIGRDPCGNEGEAFSTYTRQDTQPPTLLGVPADESVPCDAVPEPAQVGASDACDPDPEVSFSQQRIDGACEDEYQLVNTWTATDDCGHSSQASQTVTVEDREAPVLHGLPPDQVAECDAVPAAPSVTATDDCDPSPDISLLETRNDGPCDDEYEIVRQYTATDRCGKTTTATRRVQVRDTQPPVLTGVPADAVVECDAVPPPGSPAATDNCDPDPDIAYTETIAPGPCPQAETRTRRWTATDRCGNSSFEEQVITVRDTQPPILTNLPADETVECDEVPDPAAVGAVDACDPSPTITFREDRVDGDCEDRYQLRRRWTAIDHCGNSATHVQVITVRDTLAPVLSGIPADETVECDAVPPPGAPAASDNCDPDPAIGFVETRTDGPCEDTYTLTHEWTATDRCGNASSEEQVITVQDTQAPVLADVPADAVAECDSVPPPAAPTAVDNCDPLPRIDFVETRTDGPCEDTYELEREWTTTDRCGNASSETQLVTVRDTQAPVLAGVPADETVECDAVPAPAEPTASDNCDPDPAISFVETRADGPCEDTYTLTRTWTATDRCGNASSESQLVTVQDTQPPVLSGVPADQTVECDAVPPPAQPTASDNCDPDPAISFVERKVDGRCPGEYTLVRTWTATDRCGNAHSETQVITVVDTTPPAITGNPDDDACLWPPNHWYVCMGQADFAPAITDNCSEPITWRFVGCASDQPDDARETDPTSPWNGDGHTTEDCVIAPDGLSFCVRSERCGTGPTAQAGRHYGVAILATDACGNSTDPTVIGTILVPHDQHPHEKGCIKSTHEGLRPNEPLPWQAPTRPRRR